MKESIIELLEELKEYMDNKAADDDYETDTGYIPNEEIRLRVKITEALEYLKNA